MKSLAKNKKALSTVVTTLIILVVSVLLAGVVTMYAINITSTRTQQEDLRLSKQAIWVYANGTAFAAVSIDNVGGRDVVLDKVQVRGVEASWSTVYYTRRSSALSASLNCPNADINWSESFTYATGSSAVFDNDSYDKPLASGDTMVIYITSPDSLNVNDIGTTIGITVFTENAQYYVECNVKSAETA
ncbi:type IV pilin [Candidatus Bathyarchaeota archaeon]|nr:type IV pilin [Candidatus Bathyarchaeota archaeon]